MIEVEPESVTGGKNKTDGKFAPGNQFWRSRVTFGNKKKFENSDELWETACGYFQWNVDNPLEETKLFAYEGDVTSAIMPKVRAMSVRGLCLYLGVSLQSWYDWRKTRADLAEAIERIEDVIYTQKFENASAGLLNSNIISRDLGLVDRTEQVATINLTVAPEDAAL